MVGGLKLGDISALTNASKKVLKDGEGGQEEESIVVENEMLTQVCKQQKEFSDEHVHSNKASEDVRKAEAKMVEAEQEMSGNYHWGQRGAWL